MLIAALAALVAAAALATARLTGEPEWHGTAYEPAAPENFTLRSATGPVRLADYRGEPVVLVFGYTRCPDVCPTTLARLARAMRLLGRRADRVRVVMVTVDPEHDTPALLARYTAAFDPRFTGLGGSPVEVDGVAAHFGIYRGEADPRMEHAGHGRLPHTPNPLVLGPDGSLRLVWPEDATANEMTSDLRRLLRER